MATTTPTALDFSRASPWSRGDLLRAGTITLLGLLCAGGAWYQTSKQNNYDDQILWVYVAVAAAVLCCLGMVLWLVAGFRVVRRSRVSLMSQARMVWGIPTTPARGAAAPASVQISLEPVLVIAARQTRFHRPGCLAVRTKSVHPLTLAEARQAGFEPCGMCARE